jgi:hypothetical protein
MLSRSISVAGGQATPPSWSTRRLAPVCMQPLWFEPCLLSSWQSRILKSSPSVRPKSYKSSWGLLLCSCLFLFSEVFARPSPSCVFHFY